MNGRKSKEIRKFIFASMGIDVLGMQKKRLYRQIKREYTKNHA